MDAFYSIPNATFGDKLWTRFLHKEDAHFYFKDETIIISSARSYRDQPTPIGDSTEGRVVRKIDSFVATGEDPEGIDKIREFANKTNFIKFEGEISSKIKISVRNSYSANSLDYHVFCVSEGYSESLYQDMADNMRKGGLKPYDLALKVKDLYGLAKHIAEYGYCPTYRRFVHSLFNSIYVTPITYRPTTFNWNADDATDPNPCIKDNSFSHQAEWRIVFVPNEKLDDKIVIHTPGLRYFFSPA